MTTTRDQLLLSACNVELRDIVLPVRVEHSAASGEAEEPAGFTYLKDATGCILAHWVDAKKGIPETLAWVLNQYGAANGAGSEERFCGPESALPRHESSTGRSEPVMTDPIFEALTILIEECAEVTKEVTKAQRFGLDHTYSDPLNPARSNLAREIGQVIAMAEVLCNGQIISATDVRRGYQQKFNKLAIWSNLPNKWMHLGEKVNSWLSWLEGAQ